MGQDSTGERGDVQYKEALNSLFIEISWDRGVLQAYVASFLDKLPSPEINVYRPRGAIQKL